MAKFSTMQICLRNGFGPEEIFRPAPSFRSIFLPASEFHIDEFIVESTKVCVSLSVLQISGCRVSSRSVQNSSGRWYVSGAIVVTREIVYDIDSSLLC